MLALCVSDVVSLFHQTSDKRLLWTNGEGIKFLIGFKNRSSGSQDSHSGRVEVGTESLLSMFIDTKMAVKGSLKGWFRRLINLKEPRFRKINQRGILSSDKWNLSSSDWSQGQMMMAELRLRPRRSIRKKQSNGQSDNLAVTSQIGRLKAGNKGWKAGSNSQL